MTGGRDDGVATIWAATAVAVLMVVVVAGLHVGSAVLARHRAESAADLGALAAATRAVEGERSACAAAGSVAAAAGAVLTTCRLDGWDALVEARASPTLALPGTGPAVGRARAGPDPPPDPPPDPAAPSEPASTAAAARPVRPAP